MSAAKTNASKPAREPKLETLYQRPGFRLRRAFQIASSIFDEAVKDLGVTTTQYGALWVLSCRDNVDQAGLARLMGLDRSTAGLVVSNLEKDGYIVRRLDRQDRRRKVLTLTRKGVTLLERIARPAQAAQTKVLSPFTAREAQTFLALLEKLTSTFNDQIRTPIITK